MIKNFFRKWHEYCPIFTIVTILLFPVVLLFHILSINIPAVADFVNRSIAAAVRLILAKITGILPFSLMEILFICLIPLVGVAIFFAIRLGKKEDPKPSRYFLSYLIGGILTLYTLFVFTLGTSYFGTPIHEEMGLEKNKVSAEELYATGQAVLSQAEALLDEIEFAENGSSVMPMSFNELNDSLNQTYKEAAKEYAFISSLSSHVKPVLLSKPMTYTHMSGVYTYITGEANINTNFPDSTLPYTMAHEMAHQRGVAKEDEANFTAFLICTASDNTYIRYSGYHEMLKYFINALASADLELASELCKSADPRILEEILAYNDFFEKYDDNAAATITGSVNNAYQQIQGVEEGIASYGLVVDLTVAYYKEQGLTE